MNPIDRLHQIRQDIRELELEADHIRAAILAGEISRVGDFYAARVRRQIILKDVDAKTPTAE